MIKKIALTITCMLCILLGNAQGLPEKVSAKTVLKGKLLNVAEKAEVGIALIENAWSLFPTKYLKKIDIGSSGAFEFETEQTGPFLLYVTNVHHQPQKVYLDIRQPGEYSFEIKTPSHKVVNRSEYYVLGSFNKYSFNSKVKMQAAGDKKFVARLDSLATDTFYYQITEVSKKYVVAGTSTHYRSIAPKSYYHEGFESIGIAKNGSAEIVFDLNTFKEDSFLFRSNYPNLNYTNKIYKQIEEVWEKSLDSMLAYVDKGGKPELFKLEHTNEVKSLTKAIAEEKDVNIKQFLLVSYFALPDLDKTDTSLVGLALKTIPPDSKLWGVYFRALPYVSKAAKDKQQLLNYLEKVEASGIEDLRSRSLLIAIETKDALKQPYDELYRKLLSTYPASSSADIAKKKFSKETNPLLGKTFPEFAVKPLDNSTGYNQSSLKGKYVIIDFWATWCLPCIAEFPYLNKAYTKYKDKGLAILNIALEDDEKGLKKFIEKRKEELIWNFGFDGKAFESQIAKQLNITAIPFTVLLDPNGKIIAMGEELRKEKLEQTLKKYLN